jgi:hypothetical protein
MKKFTSLILAIVLSLMVCSVATAGFKEAYKCSYPAGVFGNYEIPGRGYVSFLLAAPLTITVFETIDVPTQMPDGSVGTMQMHRFSADYDKPVFYCATHGSHTFDEVKVYIPVEAWDRFLLPASEGECK